MCVWVGITQQQHNQVTENCVLQISENNLALAEMMALLLVAFIKVIQVLNLTNNHVQTQSFTTLHYTVTYLLLFPQLQQHKIYNWPIIGNLMCVISVLSKEQYSHMVLYSEALWFLKLGIMSSKTDRVTTRLITQYIKICKPSEL